VNVLGLREILAALERRFALLVEGDRSAPERQRSLRALIAWSYDLLHADEKTLLHQLAVFRGGASLPAVIATAARQGLDAATATHLVGALVDKSLVTASFPDGEPR
jgi:predicted ATPase